MYAKINENGYPVFLTKHYVKLPDRLIINPTEEELARLGYKPVIKTAAPAIAENEVISVSYADAGDHIDEIYSISEEK